MDSCEAVARQDVFRLLNDAEGERRAGCNTTDVGMLTEHLVEARARVSELESVPKCKLTDAERRESTTCDIHPMCPACAAIEAQMMRKCELTREDREALKKCPVWGHEELDNCAACELFNAKLERDCQCSEENRAAGLCGAKHLGITRCSECEAVYQESRHDRERDALEAEIARLKSERDESGSGKSADVIAKLRTDLAIAKGRHDCGITAECRRSAPCPHLETRGAPCEECFVFAMTASVERSEAAKRETLLREIEGLNNRLQIVTDERDAAIVEAGSRPVVTKARAVKPADGPSLFDRLPVEAAPQVKAKRARKVKP